MQFSMHFKITESAARKKAGIVFEVESTIEVSSDFADEHQPKDDLSYSELIDLGHQKAEQKSFFEAASYFKAASNRNRTAKVFEQLAQALLECEFWYDAVNAAQQAAAIDPTWAPGRWTYGRALLNFGELESGKYELFEARKLMEQNEQNNFVEISDLNSDIDWAQDQISRIQNNQSKLNVFNGRVVGYVPFFELSEWKFD